MKRKIKLIVAFFAVISFSFGQNSNGVLNGMDSEQVQTEIQTTTFKGNVLFGEKTSKIIPVLTFATPNVEELLVEDELRDKNGTFYRYGVGIDVNITTQNSGVWEKNEKGDKVWRLKINYPGALAMNFIFDKFYLYDNSYINVFNQKGEQVHKTYTAENTMEEGMNNLSLCKGDLLTIELVEPKGSRTSILEMNQLFYAYRGYDNLGYQQKHVVGFGNSGNCEVNVNCSPAGDDWQDEKRGVVKILMLAGQSAGLCSGSLINNTAQDCKPYVLTAMHCAVGASQSQMNNWRFYFNYEATGCSNPSSDSQVTDNYITGCQKVAGSNDVSGNTISKSDFYLASIGSASNQSATISTLKSFNAYWNGWDVNNTAAPSGAGIHHPAGDIKKISYFTSSATSVSYSGINANTHWKVYWGQTGNGQGVTEGGSSGSPLFTYNNGNSRIVGKLSGGSSYCYAPNQPDLYGKISYDWTSAGSTNATRLKPWLDPTNSGVMVLDGSSDPCAAPTNDPPVADFVADQTAVYPGTTVNFTNTSTNNPTSNAWVITPSSGWSYAGGTNASSSDPMVTFNSVGTYTVKLTATNAYGSDSKTRTNYIVVGQTPEICDTLTNIVSGDQIYSYTFNGGDGYVYGNNYIPMNAFAEKMSYTSPIYLTGATFYFIKASAASSASTIKVKVWDDNGGEPGTELVSKDVNIQEIVDGITPTSFTPTNVQFDTPLSVSGDFYIGFQISTTPGDTVVMGVPEEFTSDPNRDNSVFFNFASSNSENIPAGWYVGDDLFTGGLKNAMHIYAGVTTVPPTASISSSATTVCAGSTVNLDASGSTNMDTNEWLVTGGTPAQPTGTNPTVTMTDVGTQTVYLLAANSCGFSHIDSMNIEVLPQPTVNISASQTTICSNESVTLNANATGATSYSWSPSTGLSCTNCASPTANPSVTTTYTVTASNGSCSATDNVTITVANGAANAAFTMDGTTLCLGAILNVDGSTSNGADSYAWTFSGGTPSTGSGATSSTVFNTAGTHDISLTITNSCNQTDVVTHQVTVLAAVSATVTPMDENCGNSDGSISISATGGTGNYIYSIDGGQTSGSNSNFNNLAAGTYSVVVSNSSSTCDSYTTTVTIGNNSSADITVGPDQTSCGGESITLTASGNGTIEWFVGGTSVGTGTSITVSPTTTTTYSAVLTDGNGCSDTETVQVTVASEITAGFSYVNSTYCQNDGDVTPDIDNGATSGVFSSTSGLSINASTGEIDLNSSTPGTYTVTNTVTSGSCPPISETFVVTVNASPAVNAGNDVGLCEGETVTLSASGADSYQWDNGVTDGVSFTPTVGTTVYTVVGTGTNGCTSSDDVTVTVSAAPIVNAGPDQTICEGEGITLTAVTNSGTVSWDNGVVNGVVFNPTETTTYTVTADNNGCTSTDEVTVEVLPKPEVDAGDDQMTCINYGSTPLAGTPAGGVFSGDGVVNNMFNPGDAGVGVHVLTYTFTNGQGCTNTSTLEFTVDACAGINEDEFSNITVSPNPATDYIEVNVSGSNSVSEIRMLTVQGQLVQANVKQVSANKTIINTANLASGPYFIQFVTNNGLITKKVIIQ